MSQVGTSRRAGMREVMTISWPIVVGMLSYTAMGVSDTLMVGWIGKTELAAVGLASMAIYMINSLFLGTLHGLKVVVAQATGAKDRRTALDASHYGIALAVPFGLIVLALSGLDDQLFGLLGGSPEVQALGREYFGIRAMGAPFWYVLIALCDYYQGTGDTKTPMKINLAVNGLNIGLDAVLIFGLGPIPAMGVSGAAVATVLASVAGMVILGVHYGRNHRATVRWRPQMAVKILKVGVPIGVRYALGTLGFAVFTSMLARMGENELAAHVIGIKIISVSFLPGHGIGEASSVLVGQYVGMGRLDLARRSFVSAIKVGVGVMAGFGLIFFLIPEVLYGVFVDDPEVIALGRNLMYIAAIFQIGDAVAMIAMGGLNGAGDTRFTMVAAIATCWLVMVPTAYILGVTLGYGAAGCWWGITAEIFVLAGVAMLRFYYGAWEREAVVVKELEVAA